MKTYTKRNQENLMCPSPPLRKQLKSECQKNRRMKQERKDMGYRKYAIHHKRETKTSPKVSIPELPQCGKLFKLKHL